MKTTNVLVKAEKATHRYVSCRIRESNTSQNTPPSEVLATFVKMVFFLIICMATGLVL